MKKVCQDVFAKYSDFDLSHKKDFIKTTVKNVSFKKVTVTQPKPSLPFHILFNISVSCERLAGYLRSSYFLQQQTNIATTIGLSGF